MQNGSVKLNHLHMHQGSPFFPIFRALSSCLQRHPSAAQGYRHAIHPTQPRSSPYPSYTNIRCQHPSGHIIVLIHAISPRVQTISILAYPLYSPAPFLYQQALIRISPFPTSSIRGIPAKFLKHIISEHSRSFSHYFSYPVPLLRTTPLVQLLLRIDTCWPLSPILYFSANFSACSIPLIHSVYHIPLTTSIHCHLRPQVLKTIHFL